LERGQGMKRRVFQKGITLLCRAGALLGHAARLSSLRIKEGSGRAVEADFAAVEIARRLAVVDVLKATAGAMSVGRDPGVFVFDGWADFGEWAGFNCDRCCLCGTSRQGLQGRAPCAFLPRMIGRFIADGRLPLPVFVAIGGLVSGGGFELVGVRPVECAYIHRILGKGYGKAVRDGSKVFAGKAGSAGEG